jgi:hypothetical protein
MAEYIVSAKVRRRFAFTNPTALSRHFNSGSSYSVRFEAEDDVSAKKRAKSEIRLMVNRFISEKSPGQGLEFLGTPKGKPYVIGKKLMRVVPID